MYYRGGCGREGVDRREWSEGGKWDNCNSIINKYIKKKKGRLGELEDQYEEITHNIELSNEKYERATKIYKGEHEKI